MKPLKLGDLAQIMDGKLNGSPDLLVRGFATDNRHVHRGDLFIAIRGARVDGHDFVPQARQAGAVATLSEKFVPGPHLLVFNVVQALARLASHYRDQFHEPVIGVTGSAGKTTTKEFIAAALSPLGPVLKTEANRNTEFTSPLMWADLEPNRHQAVVVEMGMRGFDQIKHLASFSKPTIAVITNIGVSHLELMGSRENIAAAKSELLEALPKDGVSVLWREDDFYEMLRKRARKRVLTFGISDDADCRVVEYEALSWSHSKVVLEFDGVKHQVELPAVGKHLSLNAAAALLTAVVTGVGPDEAAAAISTAKLPPMRMEILNLNGATVVMDAYNASPPSVIAALDTLASLPCDGHRMAVLGEMRELGDYAEEAHREIGRHAARAGLDAVMFYGEKTLYSREECLRAGMPHARVPMAGSIDDVRMFLDAAEPGDTILVKGSRGLALEEALRQEVAFT